MMASKTDRKGNNKYKIERWSYENFVTEVKCSFLELWIMDYGVAGCWLLVAGCWLLVAGIVGNRRYLIIGHIFNSDFDCCRLRIIYERPPKRSTQYRRETGVNFFGASQTLHFARRRTVFTSNNSV
jgi:hypothetical protein